MNDEQDQKADRVEYVERKERRSVGSMLRLLVVIALLVGIVVVALDNRDQVRVGYAFGDANAPIWIVLVAAAAAGIVIGWLVRHRPHRNV